MRPGEIGLSATIAYGDRGAPAWEVSLYHSEAFPLWDEVLCATVTITGAPSSWRPRKVTMRSDPERRYTREALCSAACSALQAFFDARAAFLAARFDRPGPTNEPHFGGKSRSYYWD